MKNTHTKGTVRPIIKITLLTIAVASSIVIINALRITPGSNQTFLTGYITGSVSIGPFCPVEQVGVACGQDQEKAALSKQTITLTPKVGGTSKSIHPDSSGNIATIIPAGNYTMSIAGAPITIVPIKQQRLTYRLIPVFDKKK